MLKICQSALVIALATMTLTACNQAPQSAEQKPTDTTSSATPSSNGSSVAPADGMVNVGTVRGDVQLPANPEPIAVYDMASLQNLRALEVPVTGVPDPDKALLETLKTLSDKPVNIGTVMEPNFEALNALQPKAIIISSRLVEKYDEMNKIAPTLDFTLDTANAYESSKKNLANLGKLFNKTDKANELQQTIDKTIADTKAMTQGKGNGLIIVVNGNKMSAFGHKSRFGFVHNEFGIPQADTAIEDSRHGQPVSFEYLQKINPDWLFVLDRSSAIGQEGVGAKQVLDNPLVHQTKAWKNNQVVYLSPDSYLAFGGYYQWLADAKIISDAFAKGSTTASASTASVTASTASTAK